MPLRMCIAYASFTLLHPGLSKMLCPAFKLPPFSLKIKTDCPYLQRSCLTLDLIDTHFLRVWNPHSTACSKCWVSPAGYWRVLFMLISIDNSVDDFVALVMSKCFVPVLALDTLNVYYSKIMTVALGLAMKWLNLAIYFLWWWCWSVYSLSELTEIVLSIICAYIDITKPTAYKVMRCISIIITLISTWMLTTSSLRFLTRASVMTSLSLISTCY